MPIEGLVGQPNQESESIFQWGWKCSNPFDPNGAPEKTHVAVTPLMEIALARSNQAEFSNDVRGMFYERCAEIRVNYIDIFRVK